MRSWLAKLESKLRKEIFMKLTAILAESIAEFRWP